MSIVLSNAGDAAARDISATLVLASPFSYVYNVNGSQSQVAAETVDRSAGDMLPGYSFTLRFALTVASDASAGVHRLTLILDYKTAGDLLPVEKTLNVDIPVWTVDVRVQNVVTVPAKVYPGDNQVAMKAWLVNSGTGSTADFQVRLVLQDPFQPSSAGSDIFFLGTIAGISCKCVRSDITQCSCELGYLMRMLTFSYSDTKFTAFSVLVRPLPCSTRR